MALSVFVNKDAKPSQQEVTAVLETAYLLWNDILLYIDQAYGSFTEEWKHYGNDSGWTLVLKLKKRTILYLFPQKSFFLVQFVYGEKAVKKACESGLPESIMACILEARTYVEGRSFRVEVHNTLDLQSVKALIDIKLKS